jgi:hypothetical protein
MDGQIDGVTQSVVFTAASAGDRLVQDGKCQWHGLRVCRSAACLPDDRDRWRGYRSQTDPPVIFIPVPIRR